MVSYKGILSATVLIFLFSPVTKTVITEEKLNSNKKLLLFISYNRSIFYFIC